MTAMATEISKYFNKQLGAFLNVKQGKMKLVKNIEKMGHYQTYPPLTSTHPHPHKLKNWHTFGTLARQVEILAHLWHVGKLLARWHIKMRSWHAFFYVGT